jgi:ascorbate-specific PTS system EIIC-type component UlaA
MNISKVAGVMLKKKPMNAKVSTLASATVGPNLINGGTTVLAQTCR